MADPYARVVTTAPDTPGSYRFISNDLDEARTVLDRFYYPLVVGAPDGLAGFELGTEVIQLGPLTVGQLQFGASVTLVAPEIDAYHVTVPMVGRLIFRQGSSEGTAEPAATAAVFSPGRSVFTLHAPRSTELNIKIERPALEAELSSLLGREVSGDLDLPATMDTSDGPGLSWSRLINLLQDEHNNHQGLLYQPLIAEQLRRGVLSGLLLSLPHRYRDELTAPAPAGPPRAIRRVIDAVHDEPERPFTVTDLADISRTSVRSLQEGFRRHLGMAPMAYLQQVRLDRAHRTLLEEDAGRITVAAVAHRWGFAHLGRFARAYRHRFGVCPSETLRTGR